MINGSIRNNYKMHSCFYCNNIDDRNFVLCSIDDKLEECHISCFIEDYNKKYHDNDKEEKIMYYYNTKIAY